MASFEALDKEQKVRASIQRDVQSLCTEACHFLGLDITKPAMELLLDVFFHKMTCYADDLERFAKHAKRSVIASDDCKLLTRRNQALTAHISSLKLPTSSNKEPAKRRRTATTTSSPKRARTAENTARTVENTAKTVENATRTVENTARTVENTTKMVDNISRTSEVVRPSEPEPLIGSDTDAIDLTFD